MQLRSGLVVSGDQQHPSTTSAPTPGVPGAPSGQQREAAFHEGVRLCLLQWTALQLAVENQWGGRNSARKAQELGENIIAWFASRAHKRGEDGTPRFYADELEDVLDEAVLQDFHVEVDDGSLEQVSQKLMAIHEECWVGNFATVLQLQQEEQQKQQRGARSAAASSRRQAKEEDEDSEDEEMEGAGGNAGMTVDQSAATDTQQLQNHSDGQASAALQTAGVATRSQRNTLVQLSQQEMDDGWQQVPVTRNRRR